MTVSRRANKTNLIDMYGRNQYHAMQQLRHAAAMRLLDTIIVTACS